MSERLTLSIVEPALGLWGGIRRILELANRLVGRGHAVTIYHSDGAPCSWMKCNATLRPREAARAVEHDTLLYNDPPDHAFVRSLRARRSFYYCLNLPDPAERRLLGGWRPALWRRRHRWTRQLRACLRSGATVLSNSTWMHECLRDELRIDSELVMGGMSRDVFHPVGAPRDPSRFIVLATGSAELVKGHRYVEAAVRLAQRNDPSIVLETYADRGVPQADMARTYSQADLFIDAQYWAGWNNPVVEAMACGVPVVSADHGAVRDFAFPEVTALVAPPGDAEAMSRAILRLRGDAALRRRLAASALEHVAQFDWNRAATRLEEALLGRGSSPARPASDPETWLPAAPGRVVMWGTPGAPEFRPQDAASADTLVVYGDRIGGALRAATFGAGPARIVVAAPRRDYYDRPQDWRDRPYARRELESYLTCAGFPCESAEDSAHVWATIRSGGGGCGPSH